MKPMKKSLLLLSVLLGLGLSACGGRTSSAAVSSQESSSASSSVVSEEKSSAADSSKQETSVADSSEPIASPDVSADDDSAAIPGDSVDSMPEEESKEGSKSDDMSFMPPIGDSSKAENPDITEELSSEDGSVPPAISISEEESSEDGSVPPVISISEEESSEEVSEITSEEQSSEPAEFIDYAKNGSVKLNLEYEGRDFFVDGIEKVTVRTCIDGDTTHFNTSSGEILKARYYGIDTPESTGKIQPYGKPASNYTKSVLEKAQANGTIVVSSAQDDYGLPNPDSTGSRYVSLVWVNEEKKNAPIDELYLLNLMIVQDGFSWVKNVSDMPQYAQTFYDAQAQAEAFKLNLHSGEPDATFPTGDFQPVSLLEFKKEIIAQMEDPTHENAYNGMKVTVTGAVAAYASDTLYISDFCYYLDEEGHPIDDGDPNPGVNGEYAGINIYTGAGATPAKFTKVGTYLQVSGYAIDSETFGFQITGANFPRFSYDPNDAQVLLTAAENVNEHALKTFNYTPEELDAVARSKNYESYMSHVQLTAPVTVRGGNDSDSKTAYTLYLGENASSVRFDIYVCFNFQPDPNDVSVVWNSYEYYVGKSFTFSGVLSIHKTSSGNYRFQIIPTNSNDIVIVE